MSGVVLSTPVLTGPTPSEDFYSHLLGWTVDPAGWSVDGDVVAHLTTGPGRPSMWVPSAACVDPPSTARRAERLGGEVFATDGLWWVRDPIGAWMCLVADAPSYRPGDTRAGRFSWAQLNTDDPDRANDFYGQLLGWTVGASDNDKFTYQRFLLEGVAHAGLMVIDQRSGDVPVLWQIYFRVDDPAVAARRVEQLGGRIVVPPTRIVAGRFTVVEDPSGVLFGLDTMTHDPIGEE